VSGTIVGRLSPSAGVAVARIDGLRIGDATYAGRIAADLNGNLTHTSVRGCHEMKLERVEVKGPDGAFQVDGRMFVKTTRRGEAVQGVWLMSGLIKVTPQNTGGAAGGGGAGAAAAPSFQLVLLGVRATPAHGPKPQVGTVTISDVDPGPTAGATNLDFQTDPPRVHTVLQRDPGERDEDEK
jgi:hypothetical protein